ncbi:MAG: hypothetical protein ACRYFR_14110 [Janthinobacterium lividum]
MPDFITIILWMKTFSYGEKHTLPSWIADARAVWITPANPGEKGVPPHAD